MGGIPQHLLSVGNLSDRDRRRALITEQIFSISKDWIFRGI